MEPAWFKAIISRVSGYDIPNPEIRGSPTLVPNRQAVAYNVRVSDSALQREQLASAMLLFKRHSSLATAPLLKPQEFPRLEIIATPSAPLAGTSSFHRLAAYTGCLRCGKVVHPTLQVSVQLSDQYRDWLMALMTVRHFVQLLPLQLECLDRRKHIQVFPIASFPVAVVPKRIPQKVQTCPFFPQVYHPRFLPIDLQLEFSFPWL
jgi:hypothetical protein